MITREYDEFICLVSQHDHAKISLDIFNFFREEIKKNTKNLEALQYSIRNHDSGWIEFDLHPKISNDNKVFTFQDIDVQLQDDLWLKSISSSINPYSSFLIYKHFRYLCENSSRDKNDIENFIKSCERLIDERIIDDKKNIIDSEEFKFELSSLQICDLISLIICREKVMGGNSPFLHINSVNSLDCSIKKVDKSVYKLNSKIFAKKENFVEIPYKQIESELIMTPKKFKRAFIEYPMKYRKLYLIT